MAVCLAELVERGDLQPARLAGGVVLAALTLGYGAAAAEAGRDGVPLTDMPVHGNWALPHEYAAMAEDVREQVGDAPVQSPGEVGALTYFCDCLVVDRFTDRGQLAELIEERTASSWLLRLNYAFLDPEELDPVEPDYQLLWRPGPPRTQGDWPATGVPGSEREHGHFTLVPAGSTAAQ